MTRRGGTAIPEVATDPVWQSWDAQAATAVVSALRAEGIPATLKRVAEGAGLSYSCTIYVPRRQGTTARRILRERGEQQYIIDMDAFRGMNRGGGGLAKFAAFGIAAIAVIVVLL
ncbi:MAG: hypothetical protein ACM3S1_05520, partial [Hyphomicrobiales bacterium]